MLSLEWTIGEASPHGSLGICSLDNPISYDALSYAWGDQEPTFPFKCNGVMFRVPSNLNLALHRIAAPGCSRFLWIDLICINQNDSEEKALQIRLMDRIYGGAGNVVVWLGEAPEGMDLALRSIPSIQNGLANIGGIALITKANFEYYGLPAIYSPVWTALGEIFRSSWFERLWTLQEVVLARKLEVRMGPYFLDWDMLSSLSLRIVKANLVFFVRGGIVRPKDLVDGLAAIRHVELLRQERSRNGFTAWPVLLEVARTRACTVGVDRIYAITGLVSEELQRYVPIDHTLSIQAVFIGCFKLIIETDPTLYLLYSPCSRNDALGLPSWCPNICQASAANPLGTLAEACGYRAGCRTFPNTSSGIKVLSDSDNIQVHGLNIDTIESVISLNYVWPNHDQPDVARETLEWEAACLKIAQEVYRMPDSVPEEHWRTLIANKLHTAMPCASNLIDDYHKMKRFLQFRKTSSEGVQWSGDEAAAMLNFSTAVEFACRGRRYFSTKNGRVGIGPADALPGDIVCIFFSGPTPYIIRPTQSVSTYKFLGESYVHGLMGSEALDMMDQGVIHSASFELE